MLNRIREEKGYDCDCIIVGGGISGLQAAIVLGGLGKKVYLFDSGKYRNYAAKTINRFITRDYTPPEEFRFLARKDLEKYDITIFKKFVKEIERYKQSFVVKFENEQFITPTIILATGLIDNLPLIPNVTKFYGINIVHCIICDGHSFKDKIIGIHGEDGAELSIKFLSLSSQVIWFADKKVEKKEKERLEKYDIKIIEEKVVNLIGEDKLEYIETENSDRYFVDALFLSLKKGQSQRSHLPEKLGLEISKEDGVENDNTETKIPGVYIIGDASRDLILASVAISEGSHSAVKCNNYLTDLYFP